MTGARIGVPAPVLYAGIAALVALLVAVGFLAGRASSGVAAPAAVPGSAGAAPARGAEAAPEPGSPLIEARAVDTAIAVAPTSGAEAAQSEPAPAAPAGASATPREVAEYFRRMDATQAAAKTWSDPSALAQEIMAQAMRGDSGGFDKLIAASTAARDGVRDITVPTPCAEHHGLTLALLEDGIRILTGIRDGVAAGDTAALTGLATSAGSLESRAKAVDMLGASLRSRYGLAAAP